MPVLSSGCGGACIKQLLRTRILHPVSCVIVSELICLGMQLYVICTSSLALL